jgi:hypothetical protein
MKMIGILTADGYSVSIKFNYSDSNVRYSALIALGFVKTGWL